MDDRTYAISEYHHWEQVHSFLFVGTKRACLIDTGLGIGNIREVVEELTSKPILVVTTHVHWDHIGGHHHFTDIAVHSQDANWLRAGLPLSDDYIRGQMLRDVNLELIPDDFDISRFQPFVGEPSLLLADGDILQLGERALQVWHTPGHSPGHICLYDPSCGYLVSGDAIYQGVIYLNFPSTSPQHYKDSLKRLAEIDDITRVLPGHTRLSVRPDIIPEICRAIDFLSGAGVYQHGSGLHRFGEFSILL